MVHGYKASLTKKNVKTPLLFLDQACPHLSHLPLPQNPGLGGKQSGNLDDLEIWADIEKSGNMKYLLNIIGWLLEKKCMIVFFYIYVSRIFSCMQEEEFLIIQKHSLKGKKIFLCYVKKGQLIVVHILLQKFYLLLIVHILVLFLYLQFILLCSIHFFLLNCLILLLYANNPNRIWLISLMKLS